MSSRDRTKDVNSLCNLLGKRFPMAPPPEDLDLVEALIVSVLTEKISESKAEHAIRRLKTAFVNWNEARVSTGGEIAAETGEPAVTERLGRSIRNALNGLYDNRCEFSLDFLKEESFAAIRTLLEDTLGLEGRPAARLMLFGLGKPALPLTEDVRRVANRLGLIDPAWAQDRAQKSLERIVPGPRMLEFYQLVSRHAEATCRRTKPGCSRCVLRKMCDFYAQQSAPPGRSAPAAKAPRKPAPKRAKPRSGKKVAKKKKSKK